MLHTCAAGREGHEPYAPCKVEDLQLKGYDYWALGHVHQREVLSDDPLIIFPGNTQGRNIRETGAKGCMLVAVDEKGRPTADFRPLDVIRWIKVAIDASQLRAEVMWSIWSRNTWKGSRGETVEGMSDGTADQLYLALRLASLEKYMENSEPLPFVVDDILIRFDDERSAAALQVLAQLANRTQVIFFTHHRHLAELAEASIESSVLFEHVLEV